MKRRYLNPQEITEFLADGLNVHGSQVRWLETAGTDYDGVCILSSSDFPHLDEELVEREIELFTGNRAIMGIDPRIDYTENWDGLSCLVTVKIPYQDGVWYG